MADAPHSSSTCASAGISLAIHIAVTCTPLQTKQLRRWTFVIVAAVSYGCSPDATLAAATATLPGPQILTQDVDRFYQVYDAAGGHPTEAQLQHDYVDSGSDGLHQFAKLRNISGETLAKALAKHPEVYSDA